MALPVAEEGLMMNVTSDFPRLLRQARKYKLGASRRRGKYVLRGVNLPRSIRRYKLPNKVSTATIMFRIPRAMSGFGMFGVPH